MRFLDGIFGAQRQAAPSLTAVFVAPPLGDQAEQTRTAKELARESDGIVAMLAGTGETCLAVACAMDTEPIVVVVTDQRTFTVKRGLVRHEMRHRDVGDVALGGFTNQGVLVTIEPKAASAPTRHEQVLQFWVASPKIGSVIRSHILRQSQGADEHTLPRDIIPLMERFGHMELDPQGQVGETGDIWSRLMDLVFPFAQADSAGFLQALANAVLPVGGWPVYGASRTIWEVLSPSDDASLRQLPAYSSIMTAALTFLRSNGVPPKMVRNYEWEYWLDSGGSLDTWIPRRPIPTADEAPISPLRPGETRRVAQLTSAADSNLIFVRHDVNGQYSVIINGKQSDDDPRRVEWEWKSAGSLYELYVEIGLSQQSPTFWHVRELAPYFPLPRPQI